MHGHHGSTGKTTSVLRHSGIVALTIAVLLVTIAALTAQAGSATESYDWPQFNFDPVHSGNNTMESVISPDNVASLTRVYRITLPDIVDGAPASLSNVVIHGDTINLLFLTTKNGHIIALNAEGGDQVWSRQYGPDGCRINNGYLPCYTTSSPALDPNRQYVYSYGLDGFVHKLRVEDGAEVTGDGWPQLCTLKPFNEKGSSALTVATAADGTSYLYVTNGGYLGDRGDYQGHVTAINLATGHQNVFNANCSDQTVHFEQEPAEPDCPEVQSAIWARAGVVYVASLDAIFMATGNGTFDPQGHDWGDTVFKLHADGTGRNGDPLDSFTPDNYAALQDYDLDLGSTAPAFLPVPPGSAIKHLAVQGGKDQKLRLIDLDNMNGHGGPGYVGGQVGPTLPIPQGDMMFTAPAVWIDPADHSTWAFVATGRGLSGLRLSVDNDGIPRLEVMWKHNDGGSSPIVANNVLYCAGARGISAYRPRDGKLLWRDGTIAGIHWQSPIVVNGTLYITDQDSQLSVYRLSGDK